MNILLKFLATVLLFHAVAFAQSKTIAITIDDLPFVGEARNFHLNMMINTMKERHVPATGFIIGREVKNDSWEMLQKFRDAGLGLGNHTFSHLSLNQIQTKQYIHDIAQADQLLEPVMTEPKYFRYPYLAMGTGEKRNQVLCYLHHKNYHIAPITIDSKDFFFNQRLLSVPEINRRHYLDEIKPFYLDFIWQQTQNAEAKSSYNKKPEQSQILLIHANLLNAYVLPDIIRLYQEKGYTFVNLEDALKTFKDQFQCIPSKHHIAKSKTPLTTDKLDDFFDWD